jgi:hypothetical protein
MKNNQWIEFLKRYKGRGLTLAQLSEIYHAQIGGRFMCCSTEKEENLVRQYISDHQTELRHDLSHLGITRIVVAKSRNNKGLLGRFIISFQTADRQELCHLTLVCEDQHWNEQSNIREPHFTINDDHYFYVFDKESHTLYYRDIRRKKSLVPPEIVDAMEKMLSAISPDACPLDTSTQRPKLSIIRRPAPA